MKIFGRNLEEYENPPKEEPKPDSKTDRSSYIDELIGSGLADLHEEIGILYATPPKLAEKLIELYTEDDEYAAYQDYEDNITRAFADELKSNRPSTINLEVGYSDPPDDAYYQHLYIEYASISDIRSLPKLIHVLDINEYHTFEMSAIQLYFGNYTANEYILARLAVRDDAVLIEGEELYDTNIDIITREEVEDFLKGLGFKKFTESPANINW